MIPKLAGQVGLITGASSGIGESSAVALARRGCSLALAARRFDLLEALASRLSVENPGTKFVPLRVDVTDPTSIDRCVSEALARLEKVDILVNNAGAIRLDWLERQDALEDVDRQVRTNLLGAMWMSRAVLPSMIARRSGHIINIASMASFIGSPTYTGYAASKFGLRGFSEALRREVAGMGVRVSVVYPGVVRTGFGASEAKRRRTRARMPRFLVLGVDAVGEAVARVAERPRRSMVTPRAMLPVLWLNALAPGLIDIFVLRLFARRERGPEPPTSAG
jgi:NADP-dependent 3-hydroxy acid dehydrogenase YdfG